MISAGRQTIETSYTDGILIAAGCVAMVESLDKNLISYLPISPGFCPNRNSRLPGV